MDRRYYIYFMVIFLSLVMFSIIKAIAAPTPEMARDVIDYYYNGQDEGPILMESKLCKTLKAHDCIEEFNASSITLGEKIIIWMKFLVPKGASYDDILVEYKYKETPWHVNSYKVEGSIRYRIADKYQPRKPGEWTITIKRGPKELKRFIVNIVKQ